MSKSTVAYWNPLSAANAGQWRWVEGLEGTVQALVLSLDADTGAFTRLTRFLPGADTSPLGATVHDFPEEVFIVSGRLHDEAFGLWLEAGHYASRPPGEAHGPFRTEEGCLVLDISLAGRPAAPAAEPDQAVG